MQYRVLFIIMLCSPLVLVAQVRVNKFGFDKLLSEQPFSSTSFCIPNNAEGRSLLHSKGVTFKYATDNWLYVQCSPIWIKEQLIHGKLSTFYLEFSRPAALGDSSLVMHSVDKVHTGYGALDSPYTGKGVLVGIVDEGLDWNHPDFRDSLGRTRVLNYWDHSTSVGGIVPQPYGYGIVWDSAAINAQLCTSTENSTAHGTTVAGKAVGNGLANGTNKGMAPDANIVIVETNFGLPNWTLTIADACDYIFNIADSLGMPAVINLSLGNYLGSHDGNDPAAEYIEQLLEEQTGRIVVCAAGNSGTKGKYHVHGDIDSDTSFVWIVNNPSAGAALGPNHIYFDLWSDQVDANFQFAYGADLPGPTYSFRGNSPFRQAQGSINIPTYDTIYNAMGQRIATIETYTEIINGSYHLEGYFSNVDSTSYLFRFMTTGGGSYDMWSGSWMGINDFVTNIPSPNILPNIVHYHMPDSLQTIVSSWNCSEKVISVGNIRNRAQFINKNGNVYSPPIYSAVGQLHPTSSKGPSRTNVIKPDVSAGGEVSLGAAPIWLLSNSIYNNLIDSGGWHVINGGTSMASPVVAGIGALFLEKCDKANYQDYKESLFATCFTDGFTGGTPTNSYGHGKPNAYDLLLQNQYIPVLQGEDTVCTTSTLSVSGNNLSTVTWNNGFEGSQQTVQEGEYSALVYNDKGCKGFTDTFQVVLYEPQPMLPIFQSGNYLVTLSLTNYQWTKNGIDIPGATEATLELLPPYGVYTCYSISPEGCISETAPFSPTTGLNESVIFDARIVPNPSSGRFQLISESAVMSLKLMDLSGKIIPLRHESSGLYDIGQLSNGTYLLEISSPNGVIVRKIMKCD